MPESFADAGADYLEQLLDAALRAPASGADPASGRISSAILVALAATNEDERVEPYLSWGPGRPTVYDVRCFDENEQLVAHERYPRAGEAIRATRGCVTRTGHTARVVAVADDGEERWMMAIREGAGIYRVPDPAERPDPQPTGSEVVGALRELLAGMTVHVDATAIEQVVRNAMEEFRPTPLAANGSGMTSDPGTLDTLVRAVVAQVGHLIPGADEIAERVSRQISAGSVPTSARPDQRPAPMPTRARPTLPPPRVVPARTQTEH